MSTQSAAPESRSLAIRRATPADAEVCGKICFDAFGSIAAQHNFPTDVPASEHGSHLLNVLFSNPGFFCIVAESDGKIIGSNCLDERGTIAGLGPITIDPSSQNHSAGRQLMDAAMSRAAERKFSGVRLVQAAYHNRSLSLYAKLGFVVREPLACMQGHTVPNIPAGYRVRPATTGDAPACNAICFLVHGHDRAGELNDAIQMGSAVVAESEGRIRAYATSLAFFGHAVAETTEDLQALIASAAEFQGSGILVPTRNAPLFKWCLERGLRVVQPMTLMTIGLYNEPAGAYLPSVLY